MENETPISDMGWKTIDFHCPQSNKAVESNENVPITIFLPKIEPKKLNDLKRLQKQQEDFQRKLGAEIDKRIIDYTKELHQKHPEMAGRTLQEIGIQPYITMGNGFYNIEFKPL